MKKQYFFLLTIFLFCSHLIYAQLIPPNVFMQGQWLEIGELPNGAFGVRTSPAGFHAHNCCGTAPAFTTGAGLDMSYDWGHDGWSTGTPAFMGPYGLPGYPQEGWAMQVNGVQTQAYCTGGGTFSGTGISGAISAYIHTPGIMTGVWSGLDNGLTITQSSRVDTYASWVVVTTLFKNLTVAPIANVYYMRTLDPDNAAYWGSSSGGYTTINTIVHQNDWDHRVQVSATDPGYGPIKTYLSLGTKDCRAMAFICPGLVPTPVISDIYSHTGTATVGAGYFYNGANTQDQGIGICWKLGTINPNDSAIISYAYIFDNDNGIDSALPDPILNIGGLMTDYPVYPFNTMDTLDACLYPTLDSVPLTIPYATDKDWSWSTWTWYPATGLSATTGTSVTVSLTLPGVTSYTVIGVDSSVNMLSCNYKTFIFTIKPCHSAWNNSPCFGTTIQFEMMGDSLGATYLWKGPHGFTSTIHDATIYPATFADTGWYFVYKTTGAIIDTDSTYVIVHPKPTLIVSDNSPLCSTMADTLKLSVVPFTPGETFLWTGPAAFGSTLEFPLLPGFGGINTGTYTVVATTSFGCKDTGTVFADTIPPPAAPVITDMDYCQGKPFVPFTVLATGSILWYTGPVGGTGSSTAPIIPTTIPGIYNVWATQTVGACESPRGTDRVHVTPTPPVPLAAGGTDYCQYHGPFVPLKLTLATASAQALWYTVPTGGSASFTEPFVDINTAGTYSFWVSQTDSGCEGPRLPIVINVHPKPAQPVVTPQWYCQYWPAVQLKATASGSGDALRWYSSPGDTIGNAIAPVPPTATPGVDTYYVNETSTFGCAGDRAIDTVRIRPRPSAPLTQDTTYCQYAPAAVLTADSLDNSRLNWYILGVHLSTAPVPPNNTPGTTTWYVSQTIEACESDSTAIKVTTIYQPNFYITPQRPWTCQFDSMWLSYTGPVLTAPSYIWSIPSGTAYARNPNMETGVSLATDSMIYVRFDSVSQNTYFHLHASDNNGMCFFDTVIRINVIPHPTATSNSKSNVCAGDTVSLALSSRSADASIFTWAIDNVPMETSTALNIVAHNSNSGGPFSISWNDSGRHVITVQASTPEGCTNPPTPDTVFVHTKPDASFIYTTKTGTPLCLEDSVQFIANASENYNYSFAWSPEHFFQNINKGVTWGKVEQSKSIITLQVSDPFGCNATTMQEIDPSSCCTVSFPNAFTPNGDGHNDLFRPIFVGYHRFHVFRIANRWGQTVYESTNSKMQWDGTYNGIPQDMGVYFYYLQFDCGGNTIEQSGDVTLIR